MPNTLSDYQAENDWGDLDAETKINVLSTYIIDLENKVEKLERDIDIIDGGL